MELDQGERPFAGSRGKSARREGGWKTRLMRPVQGRFEGGVLKSAERLDLRQGERVRLLVLRRSHPKRCDLKRLAAVPSEDVELATTGLDTWADALDTEDRR